MHGELSGQRQITDQLWTPPTRSVGQFGQQVTDMSLEAFGPTVSRLFGNRALQELMVPVEEMTLRDPTVRALSRLQSLLLNVADVNEFLQQVADLAAGVVEPPASCGINARFDGQPLTVVASDDRAARLDQTQFELDDGPCLQAMSTGQSLYVSDVATELRWADYITEARKQGLQSSLSLPLTIRGQTVGAMNLFAFHAPHAFNPEEQQRCLIFAAQAAGALQLATRRANDDALRDQLEEALMSRAVIDQAIGILMGQQRCSAAAAFSDLRHRSENNNQKLRDVAADIVVSASGQPPELGKPFRSSLRLAGRDDVPAP